MTHSPPFFADPSAGRFNQPTPMDALSDVLHAVRLRGDTVIRCAPPPPFRIEMPLGLRALHIAETGGLQVQMDALPSAVTLGEGDMVLVARGDRHTITSPGAPDGARPLAQADICPPDHRLDASGPGWVTGTFAIEHEVAGPLLSALPPAVLIPARAPGREWLPLSLRLLLAELETPRAGAAVMTSRIIDLLFIHALREWAASKDASPGWLTAVMDPELAPVLTAIHNAPQHPWTVTELAALTRQSRSSFAQRFTRLLGQSPVAYIAERRLDQAASLLRSTTMPVNRVAHSVGYASDAAFTRAFQRRFGAPPLRWRKGGPSGLRGSTAREDSNGLAPRSTHEPLL